MARSLFLDDLATKLMAIGLAVVVWVFLEQLDREAVQEIPVTEEVRLMVVPPPGIAVLRVMTPDEKVRLDGPTGGTIHVTLRGLKNVLNASRRNRECRHHLQAEGLDSLSGSETRIVISKLQDADFDVPRGIEVTDISPKDIHVEVAQEAVRPLRIADNPQDCLVGRPPEGFVVDGIAFSPTHVYVRGLRHILDRLHTIPIIPVDISDRAGSFTHHVQIVDTVQGSHVTTDESIVMTVTMREVDAEATVADLRVELLFPPGFPWARDRARLLGPPLVTARLKGPRAAVELLAGPPRRIRVLADLGAADLSRAPRLTCPLRAYRETPDAAAPVQVTLEPATVTVQVAE